jgi:GT2 family glycosyltransferase
LTIDVVFVCYERKEEAEFNLKFMVGMNGPQTIICVDNGSKNPPDTAMYNKNEKVKLIRLNENVGMEAYNIGVKHSRADIIILLDDDSHVSNEVFAKVGSIFENDPSIGALAMKIVLEPSKRVANQNWRPGPVTSFWGCGVALRRDLWHKLGGYRRELFLYSNEIDLAIRIWNAGFKVIYEPTVIAFHRVSTMNRTSGRLIYRSVHNDYAFIKRYFDKKYHSKLLLRHFTTWFVRAMLSGSISSFIRATREILSSAVMVPSEPVEKEVQLFYIKESRILEPLFKKMFRKFADRSIFAVQEGV